MDRRDGEGDALDRNSGFVPRGAEDAMEAMIWLQLCEAEYDPRNPLFMLAYLAYLQNPPRAIPQCIIIRLQLKEWHVKAFLAGNSRSTLCAIAGSARHSAQRTNGGPYGKSSPLNCEFERVIGARGCAIDEAKVHWGSSRDVAEPLSPIASVHDRQMLRRNCANVECEANRRNWIQRRAQRKFVAVGESYR